MTDYSTIIFNLVEYEVWCNLRMSGFLLCFSEGGDYGGWSKTVY